MMQIKIFRLQPVQGIGKADKNVEAEVNEFLELHPEADLHITEDRIIVVY